MILNPTNEYYLRRAVIRKLLKEGWERENLRIEIPMCTASSGGRADIVCLSEDYLGCIELKSGKDKLEDSLLKQQLKQYERVFDYCAVVVDYVLKKEIKTTTYNGYSLNDNFRNVDVVYRRSYNNRGCFTSAHDSKAEAPYDKITPHLFPLRRPARLTSVYDMASVMWADELRRALKSKGTKSSLEIVCRDNYGVKEFRPILLKALTDRPLNEWEIKFWDSFDRDSE